jgi:hypothetical protein
MSTKISIFYDEASGVHLYHEGLEGRVRLEIDRPGVSLDVMVMTSQEWEVVTRASDNKLRAIALDAISRANSHPMQEAAAMDLCHIGNEILRVLK